MDDPWGSPWTSDGPGDNAFTYSSTAPAAESFKEHPDDAGGANDHDNNSSNNNSNDKKAHSAASALPTFFASNAAAGAASSSPWADNDDDFGDWTASGADVFGGWQEPVTTTTAATGVTATETSTAASQLNGFLSLQLEPEGRGFGHASPSSSPSPSPRPRSPDATWLSGGGGTENNAFSPIDDDVDDPWSAGGLGGDADAFASNKNTFAGLDKGLADADMKNDIVMPPSWEVPEEVHDKNEKVSRPASVVSKDSDESDESHGSDRSHESLDSHNSHVSHDSRDSHDSHKSDAEQDSPTTSVGDDEVKTRPAMVVPQLPPPQLAPKVQQLVVLFDGLASTTGKQQEPTPAACIEEVEEASGTVVTETAMAETVESSEDDDDSHKSTEKDDARRGSIADTSTYTSGESPEPPQGDASRAVNSGTVQDEICASPVTQAGIDTITATEEPKLTGHDGDDAAVATAADTTSSPITESRSMRHSVTLRGLFPPSLLEERVEQYFQQWPQQQPASKQRHAGNKGDAVDDDVPDYVIRDSFASISERKTWYRVARQGSLLKHNSGDGDNDYRPVVWATSAVQRDTIKIVRRWTEEDSLAGGPVLGGLGGGLGGFGVGGAGAVRGNVFGWNSPAESAVSLEQVYKKSKSSSHHHARTDTVATIATATTVSPSSSVVASPRLDQLPRSFMLPPEPFTAAPLKSMAGRFAGNVTTKPPSAPRLQLQLAAPLPAISSTLSKNDDDFGEDDDEDEWGEMVSSPTTVPGDMLPNMQSSLGSIGAILGSETAVPGKGAEGILAAAVPPPRTAAEETALQKTIDEILGGLPDLSYMSR